jgi:AcrR family transcriptional regulator
VAPRGRSANANPSPTSEREPELTAAQRIRQRARDETRRVLLEAGLEETIARGGLESPSIDAICARAGYTRGAFYVHFRDREHFEAEMFEWVLNDILRSLWANALGGSADIREIVRRFNMTMAVRDWPDLHGDIRAGYLAVLRLISTGATQMKERHAKLMTDIVATLEESVRAGQADGALRPDMDARGTAMLLLLSAIGSIVWDGIGIDLGMPALGESLVNLLEPPASHGVSG